MDQKTVFTQMQQFGQRVAEADGRVHQPLHPALAEVEKFEKQGVAQAVTAVDEAGRVAKEAITAGEQISAQWRKAMNEVRPAHAGAAHPEELARAERANR